MDYQVTPYKHCDLVRISGRIDHASAPELTEILRNLNQQGIYKIVLDLTEVEFISSMGWWVLITAQKTCKRFNRGELVLVGLAVRIRSAMEMIGISPFFRLFDEPAQAVGSF